MIFLFLLKRAQHAVGEVGRGPSAEDHFAQVVVDDHKPHQGNAFPIEIHWDNTLQLMSSLGSNNSSTY